MSVMPEDHTIIELVERAKTDAEAFSDLYTIYFGKIFNYISWRVGNKQDVEDIVSDVFVKILTNLNQFEPKTNASFASWAFTIARNRVIDYYKSNNKTLTIFDLPEIVSNEAQPSHIAEHKSLILLIKNGLHALPNRQAEIISLKFFGEMSNKEIAQILDLSEKSVSSYVSRGLQTLQENLNSVNYTK
jgi:RNA polymerase sigma-70 factor, ECF subfamily